MCGILGAFSKNNLEGYFGQALHAINHRGPDNQSWEMLGDAYLGHTRLSIIDLSEYSNQPLWDATKRACIVFNGEIYNYKQLREELVSKGYHFNSEGDAEVILNLYLSGDTEWLNRLEGIFALAIYSKETQEMIIARDKYGVKPLYYSSQDSGVYFSSEIKALFQFPEIGKTLNPNAIYRSLVFLWSPGPDTILSQVQKLEPATMLRLHDNQIVEKKVYWSWPANAHAGSDNEEELTKQVIAALEESVESQLVSDVPVGAFLSGGVDSSVITAIARQKLGESFKCFTIDAHEEGNDGFMDDLPFAKEVASKLDVDLHITKTNSDIINELAVMMYYLDEPQADPAALSVLKITKKAREENIKVLLSGAGGDDLFTGYRRHIALKNEKLWSWLPVFVRKLLQKGVEKLPTRSANLRRLAKLFKYASFEENDRLLSYFFWIDPELVRGLFTESMKSGLAKEPLSKIKSELNEMTGLSPLEKMLYLERRYFLVDHNLNYTDKMSMANGVEVRVPFLDERVIDSAANISDNIKQKGNVGKYILKKAAEKYLPKSIIYRSKTGFGAPLRAWLNGELKPLVDEILSENSLKKRGIFDYKSVWDIIEQDRSGKKDFSYSIFALLCIETWCRVFIDGQTPEGINNVETNSSRFS
ncbi:asparagine synthase (glutamine-hydrolyzing) [Oceaniserpentilla sp. 4NH20-0058]|uniref:asparagine synthase (glutamine-hydrolyzing) n=1 Tax=Oceaniserpentilla sp. 4NH20-0058 TaxID=3127660 RepID=UPI003105AFE7